MALSKCSRYQKDLPISYSLGVYPTLELLQSQPQQVEQVLLSSKGSKNSGVEKIIRLCQEKGIRLEQADKVITRLGGNGSTYAVGVFRKYSSPLNPSASHLVLVNPQDTGNLGCVIRTALAFGIADLGIIALAVDIFDPKTIRAAMGANFKINFEYFADFSQYASRFDRPLFLFMTDGRQELSLTNFPNLLSLVFGSESGGLSNKFTQYGQTVRITQSGQVDSLNLAVAVGIGLHSVKLNGSK